MYNQIIHGNCKSILKNFSNEEFHLIVSSPPYFNVKDYSYWNSYDEYLLFLEDIFKESFRVLKNGRMACINISSIIIPRKNRQSESKRIPLPYHFVNLMEKIGWKFIEDIIWKKPEGASKNRNGGFFNHRQPVAYKPNIVNEFIFVFQKPANFLIDKIVRNIPKEIKEKSLIKEEYERTNIWEINPETNSKHPAPYPIELVNKLIKYYSYAEEIVLDPFVGSGTTALSAKLNKRKFIGIEIHQEYVDLANERLKI